MSEIMPPMYQQVKNYLIRKIESKEYAEGEKLPSERDLSDKFQVSRMTARNAILELVKEGYVYRDGARGTIVSPRKVKRNFLSAAGFTEHQRESGVCDSRTRLIEAGLTEADAWLSSRLNIPLGTSGFCACASETARRSPSTRRIFRSGSPRPCWIMIFQRNPYGTS